MKTPIKKTESTVILKFTKQQLREIRKAFHGSRAMPKSVVAVEPVVEVNFVEPAIKVHILTPEFSKHLVRFLESPRFI